VGNTLGNNTHTGGFWRGNSARCEQRSLAKAHDAENIGFVNGIGLTEEWRLLAAAGTILSCAYPCFAALKLVNPRKEPLASRFRRFAKIYGAIVTQAC
jgi:hypothetical protein